MRECIITLPRICKTEKKSFKMYLIIRFLLYNLIVTVMEVKFVQELINAEVVTLHDFEKREIFEGCMPVEIMAKRGIDTLRFGPLKPVGFDDPRYGKRP